MGEVTLSGSVSVPDPSESEAASSHESATSAFFVAAFFAAALVMSCGAGECEGEGPVEVEILRLAREASSSVAACQ